MSKGKHTGVLGPSLILGAGGGKSAPWGFRGDIRSQADDGKRFRSASLVHGKREYWNAKVIALIRPIAQELFESRAALQKDPWTLQYDRLLPPATAANGNQTTTNYKH
ncbi:hypothetical protein NPIL_81531 [Nephila pilipes]|uniref:Uncharacterized protein n=1 Tax=Nephila pilipes TaxID=299642 RepID=A0A8X6N3P1_NEPPI|nr:hypothetical protein NPIL_81531 [Nephila pilipes]